MVAIDAIFFDVDGTLVDSRKDITIAMNHALTKLGLQTRREDEIVSYVGTGVRDLIKKSLGAGNESRINECVRIFSDYYLNNSTRHSALYPHVREVLEYFKDKSKYILTNRYSRFADATLRGFGIRDYFKGVLGGDDEACLKPSACVLDKFFQESGIDRKKVIIVGDMAIDIMTGKNSSILTCWVTYGLGKPEEVRLLRPDFIIDDLIQLEKIIR